MSETKKIIIQQNNGTDYNKFYPQVDGWSKVEVLSDLTKELLGLGSSAIPDDAFVALTVGKDSKAYRVKVTYPNGQPAVGFTVGGLTAFPALGLTTNSDGIVMGSSTSTTPTITVAQKYDDVLPYSGSFTSTRMITDCNVVLSWNEIPTKKNTRVFSPNLSNFVVKCACLLVGGGGGGGRYGYFNSNLRTGGGGGAGGACVQEVLSLSTGNEISISVGAGGNDGSQRRMTELKILNQIITALGGSAGSIGGTENKYYSYGGEGGKGNGNGGKGGNCSNTSPENGEDGLAGTTKNFYGVTIKTGGGGGGGSAYCYNGQGFYSDCGSPINSDVGQRRTGMTSTKYSVNPTVSFDSNGKDGGCWIVYLHS